MGPARTNPMRMHAVSEDAMRAWVAAHGGAVVETAPDEHTPPPIRSLRYLVVPSGS